MSKERSPPRPPFASDPIAVPGDRPTTRRFVLQKSAAFESGSWTQSPVTPGGSRAIAAALEVPFDASPRSDRMHSYRVVADLDGTIRIESIREPLVITGRWDPRTKTLALERIQWTPSDDHPVGFDVSDVARAAAGALVQLLSR